MTFVMILQNLQPYIRIRGRVKNEKLQNALVSAGSVMHCTLLSSTKQRVVVVNDSGDISFPTGHP